MEIKTLIVILIVVIVILLLYNVLLSLCLKAIGLPIKNKKIAIKDEELQYYLLRALRKNDRIIHITNFALMTSCATEISKTVEIAPTFERIFLVFPQIELSLTVSRN